MKFIKEIGQKDAGQWPKSRIKAFMHTFRTITGRMNGDGDIFPCNEPVFWKKEKIPTDQATASAETVIGNIPQWIGCPASELKNYYLDVWVQYDNEGDSAEADNVVLAMMESATVKEMVTILGHGNYAVTRGRSPASHTHRLFPGAASTSITLDASAWASSEHHRMLTTVIAYRMPDNVCYE